MLTRPIDERKPSTLDRIDWPEVGDEVLYHQSHRGWMPATVLDVAQHDGDLKLDTGLGESCAALDSKHGIEVHDWLLYEEWRQIRG
jgi:hypothetical protein